MSVHELMPTLNNLVRTQQPADYIDAAMTLVQTAFRGQYRYGNHAPMSVHSIRVGLQLERYGDDLVTVLGGFCHDLVEDTPYGPLVGQLFGPEVANVVIACSLDEALYQADNQRGNEDLMRRAAAFGPRAIRIKVVDITDNLHTLGQVPQDWREEMLWCAVRWLELGQLILGADTPHCRELQRLLAQFR